MCKKIFNRLFFIILMGMLVGVSSCLLSSSRHTENNDPNPQPTYDSMVNSNNDTPSLTVFQTSDNGNAAPQRTIAGANTALNQTIGVWAEGGEFFATNFTSNSITVYLRTDNGNVAPQRTIAGANTSLDGPEGIYVGGGEIFVANYSGNPDFISVYLQTDDGDVTPRRVIVGSNTGLDNGAQSVYVYNGEIFVGNDDSNSILVFQRNDNGNVSPQRTITGSNTGIDDLALFVTGSEIFTTNEDNNSVRVFQVNDNGNVPPQRIISGANTGLAGPLGIFVANGEIFVLNRFGNTITVYGQNDSGNVAPRRSIAGGATGLNNPWFLAPFNSNARIPYKSTQNTDLSWLSVVPEAQGLSVRWTNPSKAVAGFYLWRAKTDKSYNLITPILIEANHEGKYSYLDMDALYDSESYYYKLQQVNHVHGNIWDRAAYYPSKRLQEELKTASD